MKRNVLLAGGFCFFMVMASISCHAGNWVKNNVDVPNKNLESNYYDADSVKVRNKTLVWTEKFVLTGFGSQRYSKHLMQYPACRQNMSKKGEITQHQIDFEIKGGKFRTVAKRNYNKKNELVCTDKDMGNELDKKWYEIVYRSPMYERHYILTTKFKIGDI